MSSDNRKSNWLWLWHVVPYDKGICVPEGRGMSHRDKHTYTHMHMNRQRIAYSVVTWHFHHSGKSRRSRRKACRVRVPHVIMYIETGRRSRGGKTVERVGRSWALWIWLCLRWVSHWLQKRELAAFSSIAFYMQTSLAELQFPSSCTLSFPLSLAIFLCFSLGSYIYSCVYMSIWVWVWVLVCACEWVSAHSFAHALIHFHHLYVVKSAEFNVLRLSDLHFSLLPFSLLFSLFIFPFFFPILTKLSCDFVHLISVCESVVWLSMDFLLVRHAKKSSHSPFPPFSWYLFWYP